MSGGHFEYKQFHISEIIDSIEREIEKNGKEILSEDRWSSEEYYIKYPEECFYTKHPDEILNEFKECVKLLKKAQIYAQRIDWFLSGDDGQESFIKRLKEDLNELK